MAAPERTLADRINGVPSPRFRVDAALRRALEERTREADQASGEAAAYAQIAAAEVAIRLCDWPRAAELYRAASEGLAKDDSVASAVAHARSTTCVLLREGVAAARAHAESIDWLREGDKPGRATAEAVVLSAKGDAAEARALVKRRPAKIGQLWSDWWLSLISAEVLLEMGGLIGAAQGIEKLASRFEEVDRENAAYLQLLRLRAATHLAQRVADEESVDGDQVLLQTLDELRTRSRHFPLYRAWAAELSAERALLLGEAPDEHLRTADETLRALDAPFLAALFEARRVEALQAAAERQLKQAREALAAQGATRRASKLQERKKSETAGPEASRLSRMSIQLRLEGGLDELTMTDESGLEAVIEVSRYLSSIRTLDELLEKILSSIARVMKAERGALLASNEEGELSCRHAKGVNVEDVTEGSGEITFGVLREAERSGEAVLTDNALADERFRERASVMATDIRSVLCAPIRTRDRTLGFIYLDRRVSAVPFNEDHKELLAAFCTQVAVAWENALAFEEIEDLNAGLEQKVEERTRELVDTRLKLAEAERDALEKEMKLARQIQEAILPADGRIERPSLSISGRVIPASYCGGDFWGLVEMGDQTLVLIADVTGHGVAASFITAVASACLDTLRQVQGAGDVSDVLRTMNRVIWDATHGQLCATAFAVLFDPKTRTARYANAGHNFPWLLGGEKVEALVAPGVRLGENPDHEFDSHERQLSEGQRLVLYTDGIVEWENPKGRQFGDRRLRKGLVAHLGQSAEETIEALIKAAEEFTAGTECDDDLTLVVVDVL